MARVRKTHSDEPQRTAPEGGCYPLASAQIAAFKRPSCSGHLRGNSEGIFAND
jgi:hypothetical protein